MVRGTLCAGFVSTTIRARLSQLDKNISTSARLYAYITEKSHTIRILLTGGAYASYATDFAHPSHIFIGVKKCEILPQFSAQVAYEALWFRNGNQICSGSVDCCKCRLGNFARRHLISRGGVKNCTIWLLRPRVLKGTYQISKTNL